MVRKRLSGPWVEREEVEPRASLDQHYRHCKKETETSNQPSCGKEGNETAKLYVIHR
jgi:hypothetical protein